MVVLWVGDRSAAAFGEGAVVLLDEGAPSFGDLGGSGEAELLGVGAFHLAAERVLEHLQVFEGLGHEGLDTAGVAPGLALLEAAELALDFLPDRRRFLFAVIAEAGSSLGTFVGSLDSPDERRLLLPDTNNVQQADGRLLFNRTGTLLAQPFDAERGELNGEPVAIASSITFTRSGNGIFGVSPGGTLAYLSGEDERRIQLTWLDRKGKQLGTLGTPGPYSQLALSPDDRRVAVEVRDPASAQFDLWVIDVSRDVMTRLTSDPGDERDPVWSPDGQEVAYGAFARGRGLGLFRKGLTGEPASPIPIESEANADFRPIPDSWSSDGKTLLYKRLFQNKAWAFPLEGGGEAEVVLDLEAAMDEPQVSPDGRWLAYTSQESGEYDVYVQPFGRPGERVRVSRNGGGPPKWRGDGKELFYQAPDGMLMAVEVGEGTAGPAVSPPTALFDAGTFDVNLDYFAVSSDGQRFLVRQPTGSDRKVQMHVISNWTSLLESGQ
jgi:eukaryotic-like serine/threonine-protein kinase